MIFRILSAWIIGGCFCQMPAFGVVAWNELVDGDLLPETTPTPLVLGFGLSEILGEIGGDPNLPGTDAFDAFSFEIPVGAFWNHFVLRDYRASPPNDTTGFAIFSGPDSLTGQFLNGAPAAADGTDLFALLRLGPLGPGTFTVGLREFATAGNQYHLEVGIVPEPPGIIAAIIPLCLTLRFFRRRFRAKVVSSCGHLGTARALQFPE